MSEKMQRFVFIDPLKKTSDKTPSKKKKSGDVMNLQVGDKVRVRGDLKSGKTYYNYDHNASDGVTSEMMALRGKIVTIISNDGKYHIAEDGNEFNWTDEMFEYVQEEF